jgi:hypothetical protein
MGFIAQPLKLSVERSLERDALENGVLDTQVGCVLRQDADKPIV